MELLRNFFEQLANPFEATTGFIVLATVSLLTFGVFLAMTGRLVVDAWNALRDERRSRRLGSSA